ncbi:LysR substrate-binding domain-containing protein [Pseudoroseomonas cervicalis]|uniref:LysR substrate binding domain protein n=1 Tax=Pseudoroseomonas cervicalis ATCC 49957 TaxID=525371 RepID=D5RQZ9_9PROT|nr:LysR family transcriptional regulator [Pseudoroseomonas cervicalis]EFH10285.1 LysR substrate binding domain protein [Pseudoroseomonas cervicalis ATCC 49957]
MDTRFLDSFVTVVEEGSIAAAARRLNLTPAALAQRIRALEEELGVRLLLRAGRAVAPSEAGLAILDRARALLRELRDLRDSATGEALAGELRLGAIATALTGLLPGLLARMAARSPALEVHVSPGISADLYRRVLVGELDAALIVQPDFAPPKSCAWHLLREEPLVLLAPEALADADPHGLLATQPFIRYDRDQWGGRLADRYLREARIRPRERYELDALDAIAVMVDRGLGVALVPDWAPPWPAGLKLARIALPRPCPPRRIGVLWLRNSARARLVRAFLEDGALSAS